MNEIKHTPGPWHWDDTVWDYDPEQQAPWLVDGRGDWILCGDIKCNEPNARLIAAAPDMADVLELIASYDDATKEKGGYLLSRMVRAMIDAALIKAGRKTAPELEES